MCYIFASKYIIFLFSSNEGSKWEMKSKEEKGQCEKSNKKSCDIKDFAMSKHRGAQFSIIYFDGYKNLNYCGIR